MNSQFEQQIQQWVSIDNQIKSANEKLKELRDKKHTLNENITKYAEQNKLTASAIQIGNDKLRFATSKVQPPLTFGYLEKCLGEVIKNDQQVKQIVEYVKNSRQPKIVSEIKRI